MSPDQVDDLEAAEDLIASLSEQLRDLATWSDRPLERPTLDAISAAITYCRPSCDMHGTPHEVVTGEFTRGDGSVVHEYDTGADCGCPCHTRS